MSIQDPQDPLTARYDGELEELTKLLDKGVITLDEANDQAVTDFNELTPEEQAEVRVEDADFTDSYHGAGQTIVDLVTAGTLTPEEGDAAFDAAFKRESFEDQVHNLGAGAIDNVDPSPLAQVEADLADAGSPGFDGGDLENAEISQGEDDGGFGFDQPSPGLDSPFESGFVSPDDAVMDGSEGISDLFN
jgi:hypothetical protein